MYAILKRIKTLHEELRKNKENLNKSKNIDDYEAVYLFSNDKKINLS